MDINSADIEGVVMTTNKTIQQTEEYQAEFSMMSVIFLVAAILSLGAGAYFVTISEKPMDTLNGFVQRVKQRPIETFLPTSGLFFLGFLISINDSFSDTKAILNKNSSIGNSLQSQLDSNKEILETTLANTNTLLHSFQTLELSANTNQIEDSQTLTTSEVDDGGDGIAEVVSNNELTYSQYVVDSLDFLREDNKRLHSQLDLLRNNFEMHTQLIDLKLKKANVNLSE